MAQANVELHQRPLAAPVLLGKSPDQVQAIGDGAARPQLAIPVPALFEPCGLRRHLAHLCQERSWARNGLALEQSCCEWDFEATADGDEGGTILVTLPDELKFGLAGLVVEGAGSHDHDVQRGTVGEVVLSVKKSALNLARTEEYAESVNVR